jgi:hypothetical protein
MAKIPKKQALSKVLSEGFPDPGMFEDIPRVRKIAGESTLPYVCITPRCLETEDGKELITRLGACKGRSRLSLVSNHKHPTHKV